MTDTFEARNPNYARHLEQLVLAMPIARFVGLRFLEILPGSVTVEIPLREELTFRSDQFQAAAIFAAADFAAVSACATLLPEDWLFATIDCSLKIVGPATGERLIAHGRVVKPGRLLTVAAAEVFIERGGRRELTATALATSRNIEPAKART